MIVTHLTQNLSPLNRARGANGRKNSDCTRRAGVTSVMAEKQRVWQAWWRTNSVCHKRDGRERAGVTRGREMIYVPGGPERFAWTATSSVLFRSFTCGTISFYFTKTSLFWLAHESKLVIYTLTHLHTYTHIHSHTHTHTTALIYHGFKRFVCLSNWMRERNK